MQDQTLLVIVIAIAVVSVVVIALQLTGFSKTLGGREKPKKKGSSSDSGFIL